MSNIKLKHLLNEQWSPDPAQKQLMQVTGDMVNKSNKQIAKSIAKNIYNSSKWYNDDEVGLIKTIKQIPNNTVYTLMQDELKKLTGGLDLASYLKTFLDRTDLATWDSILKHLKKKLPITQVYPIGKQYFKLANGMTSTKLTGTEFVPPDYVKWYKNKQVQAVNNFSYSPTATITKTVQNSVYSYRHEILDVAEIVSLFIPIVGPVLSRSVGLAHAGLYTKEGDYYSAGLYASFALIPGGAAVAKSLTRKIVTKSGMLTKSEREVLIRAAMSKDVIKSKVAKIATEGIKDGTINPNALKSLKWIKPAAKGGYNVAWGGFKNFIAPTMIYNYGYDKTTGMYDKYVTIPKVDKAMSTINTTPEVPEWLQDYNNPK